MAFDATQTDDRITAPIDTLRATQLDLEILFSKNQVVPRLRREFIAAGFVPALEEAGIDPNFGLDLLIQLVLHRRCNIPTMIGLLKRHFEYEENPVQACADMVLYACEKDFADWEDLSETVVMKYDVTTDVHDELARYQYPLPMVIPPEQVRNNRQTGYLTIKGSLILKDNHHDKDICLDHINRSNQVALTLNADVVAFVKNQWKHLDRKKDGETREEFDKRKAAFEKYDTVSRDVIAGLMAQGDRLWLTHKYDKRGRTYAQGYSVNYQGNDWNKACIEFADAEHLNEE